MSTAVKLNPQIQIKLMVVKGPHTGQSFVLNKPSFTIGRGPENEIILINDSKISRQHAQIQVIAQDVEILNLSQKNQVFVGSESVQKWKLVNESVFKIGESEFRIEFDLGQAVVPVQPVKLAQSPVKNQNQVAVQQPKPNLQNRELATGPHEVMMKPQQSPAFPPLPGQNHNLPQHFQNIPQQAYHQGPGPAQNNHARKAPQKENLLNNPKFRFYLIFGVIILGLVYWLNDTPKKKAKTEVKSTLKYEDDFLIKQNSVSEKELDQKRKKLLEQNNSPTNLRLQENFQKGMRDFNLGNYSRAMDFFQVVLNLEPNHPLAKRQLYLAKARFDEVLKSKLMLGESYYQKHNFKMCEAMYRQVLTMLQGKSNDRSYQVAQSMVEKCHLASEGIR